jgi:hypothetical protein
MIFVTIFDRRSASANKMMLYSASLYHQSHHLHTKYTFICATWMETKQDRKKREEDRDERRDNYEKREIYRYRYSTYYKKHIFS